MGCQRIFKTSDLPFGDFESDAIECNSIESNSNVGSEVEKNYMWKTIANKNKEVIAFKYLSGYNCIEAFVFIN